MKLFLHIGTEKTGSSFLQTVMAQNKAVLKDSGIYFPKAADFRDEEMLSGMISPGNGQHLKRILDKADFTQLEKYLYKVSGEAESHNCSAIIISNENIIRSFVKLQDTDRFNNTIKKLNISEVHGLLVLRDPAGFALSMYKHRAKSGAIPDFTEWIQHNFDNINVLDDFYKIFGKFDINWTVRKYQKNTDYLLSILFGDWLGIRTDELLIKNHSVNTSLTLSELEVLRILKKRNPELVLSCYNKFLQLSFDKKAKDPSIERVYKSIATEKLMKWAGLFAAYNQLLPKDEKLSLPQQQESIDVSSGLVFSSDQMNIVLQIFSVRNMLKLKGKYAIHKLLMRLPYGIRKKYQNFRRMTN